MNTFNIELAKEDRQLLQDLKEWLTTKDAKSNSKPVKYYTRKEVAKLLKVNISTVHNWTKNGTLKAVGIGSRVYYTQEAIDAALIRLN